MCFTKAYGHFAEGTGSVIQTKVVDAAAHSALFHQHEAWAGFGDRCQCGPCYSARAAAAAAAVKPATDGAERGYVCPVASSADDGTPAVGGSDPDRKRVKIHRAIKPPIHSNGDCPMLQLGLRYFTPREIAGLMGFPSDMGFPKVGKQAAGWCLPRS